MQWRVPNDDTHTTHISLYAWRAAPGKKAPIQEVVPSRHVKLLEEDGTFAGLTSLFNQDYMCWVTQGEVADRTLEKLGRSDRGVQLFRKVLSEQIDLVSDGQEPTMNIIREEADNTGLEYPRIPYESGHLVGRPEFRDADGVFRYHQVETGECRDIDKIEATMATWVDFDEKKQQAKEAATVEV